MVCEANADKGTIKVNMAGQTGRGKDYRRVGEVFSEAVRRSGVRSRAALAALAAAG